MISWHAMSSRGKNTSEADITHDLKKRDEEERRRRRRGKRVKNRRKKVCRA